MRTAVSKAFALAGLLALLAPSASALVQEGQSLADLLAGKSVPLTMKPKDLPADFKAVRLKVAGTGGGGLMDMVGAMLGSFMSMGMGRPNGDGDLGATLLSLADMSWTKGDVVKVQNREFLVTYKWSPDLSSASSGAEKQDEQAKKMLQGMELSLTLVAVDGLNAITPANYTKDDLLKLLDQVSKQPTQESLQTKTLSNAKQIGLAMGIYTSDYDDVYPYAQSTKAVQYVTYPYTKNASIWQTFNPNGTQFVFNRALGGVSQADLKQVSGTVLFYEDKEWPDGKRCVVFCDGAARLVGREEWPAAEATLHLTLPKSAKPLPLKYGMDWNPGKSL